jgi:hypothetical protein
MESKFGSIAYDGKHEAKLKSYDNSCLRVCRKWSKDGEGQPEVESSAAKAHTRKIASRSTLDGLYQGSNLNSRKSHDHDSPLGEHVPHSIC